MVNAIPLPVGVVVDSNQAFGRGVVRGIEQFAQTRPQWSLEFYGERSVAAGAMSWTQPAGLIAHIANQELADSLRALQLPVVNTSFMLPDEPFVRIGVDNRRVGQLASRHFIERGFRHFAVVGHNGHTYSAEREAGFREALSEQNHTYASFYQSSDPRYPTEVTPLSAIPELTQWLLDLPKPVGIFACRGLWAVQLSEICRLNGLPVPEDVAVVCVDDDETLCERSRPSLSSITVPSERIGFEAASILDSILEHRAPGGSALQLVAPGGSGTATQQLIAPAGVMTRQSSDVFACDDPDVAAALKFIHRHAQHPINVADVLDAVPVPRRILERKFRFKLDRGIAEEISRARLGRAKLLLATTSLSVAEVAQEVGFTSVQYLSRVFRKKTGLTPTAFRQQIREPRTAETDCH